jgi:predicted metal-binding protein
MFNPVIGGCPGRRGNEMTSIIQQTKYGDTIFVSQPLLAAQAMVTWAVETYGPLVHSMKLLSNGYVKVEISGLTTITFGPGLSLPI